jgi:hypothetical protein
VEARSGISEPVLTGTKSAEVLSSLGNNVGTEFHNNASSGLSADGDIKVYMGIRPARYSMYA